MPTSVKIIKDSTNWLNQRLTTWILEYPRYVHAEFMTHRVFSKNGASSRAIPYAKMVQNIRDNMVMPIWTENRKGMQGKVITSQSEISNLNAYWKEGFQVSEITTKALDILGVHKQNINRILEPWMHMRIIVTATDYDNFFWLRAHKDAQPEIQQLAYMMKDAYEKSIPELLQPGEWHIPFDENMHEKIWANAQIDGVDIISDNTYNNYKLGKDWAIKSVKKIFLKTSVARCARISYNNVDGSTSTVEKDIELFDKLIISEPLHASPAEHQAQVPTEDQLPHFSSYWKYHNAKWSWHRGKYLSNLNGFIQLRKLIECNEF